MRSRITLVFGLVAQVSCSRTGLLVDEEPDAVAPVAQPTTCAPTALALHVEERPPNLYFALDRSGSMAETLAGGAMTKWGAVQAAAVDLVRRLGAHVRVGATVFPAASGSCDPGEEVFPTLRGDPSLPGAGDGPVTRAFAEAIAVPVSGYTPTAATLVKLRAPLASLGGSTSVVLATDGGPNCSTKGCDASLCI